MTTESPGQHLPEVDADLLLHLRAIGDDLSYHGWILWYLASGWNANDLARAAGTSRETIVNISRYAVSMARWQRAMEARMTDVAKVLTRQELEEDLGLSH